MAKPKVKESFTLGGTTYTLKHFPSETGKDIPIDYSKMKEGHVPPICAKVSVPTPAGEKDMWMAMRFASIPPPPGGKDLGGEFVLFKLCGAPIDPRLVPLPSMIIYGAEADQAKRDMPQLFLDAVIGREQAPVEEEEGWADEIFSKPEEEEEEVEEDEVVA